MPSPVPGLHSPSENTINGKSFPMEAHFVHADDKGNLAVVALMFEEGSSNALLEKVWPKVPQAENGKDALQPEVSAAESWAGPACCPVRSSVCRSAAMCSHAARNWRASSGRSVSFIASHTSSTSRA